MSSELSERRMIENEVVFRQHNESVGQSFIAVKTLAEETSQEYLLNHDDTPLHFYCECSDENCRKRILMQPTVYTKIHQKRNRFVLIGGHETNRIEKVVRKTDKYWIVEKFIKPPEVVRGLQPTGVDNV